MTIVLLRLIIVLQSTKKGDEMMKKPSISDVALVISIFTLLLQIFCHFILPKF
nr:MAG TPA: hypothetical protein [Bacteriophage sp.]